MGVALVVPMLVGTTHPPEGLEYGREHVDAVEEGQCHQQQVERVPQLTSGQQDAEQDVACGWETRRTLLGI